MAVAISGDVFRITNRAINKIDELMESIEDSDFSDYVPVLTWISDISDRDSFIPGPHLGLNKKNDVANISYSYDSGFHKVYINLDKKRVEECRIKVLDYLCGRFFLLYDDDLQLISSQNL